MPDTTVTDGGDTIYANIPAQPLPEPSGECSNCHQRPATVFWTGEGGSLAFVHGCYESWCKPCTLKAQLDYARERAAAIPELERELAAHDEMGNS